MIPSPWVYHGLNLLSTLSGDVHERTVANNYVIRFETRLFQILQTKKELPKPKDKVLVRVQLDGSLSIIWKNNKLFVKELTNIQNKKIQEAA